VLVVVVVLGLPVRKVNRVIEYNDDDIAAEGT
jgi:hypothetical protein